MRLYKVFVNAEIEGLLYHITYMTWASNNSQACRHVIEDWEALGWGRPIIKSVKAFYIPKGMRIGEVARSLEEHLEI